MTTHADMPSVILERAVIAARAGEIALRDVCDALPVALYSTDREGQLRYFNPACRQLAGRMPVTGRDRWCVTWRLYRESGEFLPHEDCPMAVAIKEQRPIRGVRAIAERPDGSRVMILPHPTPVHDKGGQMIGAINLLLGTSGGEQAEFLRAQAARCRRLAASVGDQRTVETLRSVAADYERRALEAQSRG